MKFKHLLTATALMLSISVVAQPQAKEEAKEEEGFKFTTIKELPETSVNTPSSSHSTKMPFLKPCVKTLDYNPLNL